MNKYSYKVCYAYLMSYFSLNLSRYSQKYLPASPIGTSYSPDSAKWGWFESNVGVVKIFTCITRATLYILPPQPVPSFYTYGMNMKPCLSVQLQILTRLLT